MEDRKEADIRRTGGAMSVAGALFIALGILVVRYDLPTPGGNVYSSHLQSIILIFAIGTMLLLAGLLDLRRAREGGTETLSTPGPIDGDDGPSGTG